MLSEGVPMPDGPDHGLGKQISLFVKIMIEFELEQGHRHQPRNSYPPFIGLD